MWKVSGNYNESVLLIAYKGITGICFDTPEVHWFVKTDSEKEEERELFSILGDPLETKVTSETNSQRITYSLARVIVHIATSCLARLMLSNYREVRVLAADELRYRERNVENRI